MATKKTTKPKAASDKAKHPPKAQAGKTRSKTTEDKLKKPGVLDGAVKVLAEADEPLSCRELIERMASKGYWKSPAGKTPSATLYSAILRELKTKGSEARFKKVERGRFALNEKRKETADA